MRLGIVSDTHDEETRCRVAVKQLKDAGATTLVHCGDLTSPEIVFLCALLDCHFVFGNCDDDLKSLQDAAALAGARCWGRSGIITLPEGVTVGITHGDDSRLFQSVLAQTPRYLCFGHSHRATDRMDENGVTRLINPGALKRAENYTVALLDTDTDVLQFITVR